MEELTRIIMKREIISDESKKKERERKRKEFSLVLLALT